ncbi:MAG: acetyltransferase family protein [Thermoleophilia bacterium]|nr:acetyltransferase family protein [Thermoleophilia bacterium]
MRVRPFASDDADAVRAILDATYGDDRWVRSLHEGSHGLPVDHPHFRRSSLVAELDGVVVAAGTITSGQRHPRRSWLEIEVAPAERRSGIGTALLGELRGFTERPLCARGRFVDEAAIGFLRRHGFGLLDRSWGGRFDPGAVVERLPEPTVGQPPTLDEAAAFFERWYCETHHFDPPTPWPLERARAFFCGDDLVAGSLVGVWDDGSLRGAATLIRTPGYDPGDELYLVWAGTLGTDRQVATSIVAACLQFAQDAGKAVRFEVNEANAAVLTALDQLGVLGEPDLGIFAEDAATS